METRSEGAEVAPTRLITPAEVYARTTLCRTTIYRQLRAGRFPPPVRVGRRLAWSEATVSAWIDAQVAQAA